MGNGKSRDESEKSRSGSKVPQQPPRRKPPPPIVVTAEDVRSPRAPYIIFFCISLYIETIFSLMAPGVSDEDTEPNKRGFTVCNWNRFICTIRAVWCGNEKVEGDWRGFNAMYIESILRFPFQNFVSMLRLTVSTLWIRMIWDKVGSKLWLLFSSNKVDWMVCSKEISISHPYRYACSPMLRIIVSSESMSWVWVKLYSMWR